MQNDVPNLTLLRQFTTIAEERGISKAAKRLRISQPALSKNIRRLEEMLGTPVFERHSGGTDLTRAGRIFLERMQVIGLEYQHALQDIRNVLSEQVSTIRIGAGPIWSSTILPQVAERFHALYPRHRLMVLTGPMEDLGEDLRLGRIDLFAGALIRETKPPGFIVKQLAESEMVVLASEDHDLMRIPGPVAVDLLAEYPFVAFQPAPDVLEAFSSYLRARGAPPPRFLLETSSLYACSELVRTGKYLFYETKMIAQKGIGMGISVVPLAEPILRFEIGIVHRQGLDRMPHYSRLIRIMTEVLAEIVGTPPKKIAPDAEAIT